MSPFCNDQPHNSSSNPSRCKILRLTELNKLISADVFESNFSRACREWADICYEHPQTWLEKITAPKDKGKGISFNLAVKKFASNVAGYDYISPGFNGFHLLPLLAFLRSQQDTRLLFIAHAPVQHAVELSLVKDLLRPGDVIICPSVNARKILCVFSSEFARYTVVIPHFTHPLPRPEPLSSSVTVPRKLVSLGRITEDKLIHRQIDAMAILKQQGVDDIVMEIAGPCQDENGRTLSYVNELQARIRRLGLDKHVVFKGTLHTPEEKGAFFASAAVCINLSRAEEESFGKSCAEAIIMGIPVISTHWNGLPETVGKCGEIIPLSHDEGRQIVDIDPADCAQAIIKLLHIPPQPADFSCQAQLFSVGGSGADYKKTLLRSISIVEDMSDSDASVDFFALIPAIRAFSPPERRYMYLAFLNIHDENCPSGKALDSTTEGWELLAELIFQSVRARGQKLLSHQFEYTPAPPLPDTYGEILACSELLDKEISKRLLADCLLACDPWSRELTLIRLTALSPALSVWSLKILRSHCSSTSFLFRAEVNRLLACGEVTGAAYFIKKDLAGRDLQENDTDLMLYFLEICRQADCVNIMTDILEPWLKRYPDAPQCSVLWPVLAINLIIYDEQYEHGKSSLAQIERIIPDFDTSKLRSALTALEYV
jgi:glycosyltransferase involved in cell wall biosynthesis